MCVYVRVCQDSDGVGRDRALLHEYVAYSQLF